MFIPWIVVVKKGSILVYDGKKWKDVLVALKWSFIHNKCSFIECREKMDLFQF